MKTVLDLDFILKEMNKVSKENKVIKKSTLAKYLDVTSVTIDNMSNKNKVSKHLDTFRKLLELCDLLGINPKEILVQR